MLPDNLLDAESERVEWKESTRDAADFLHAVCALANDLGASGLPGYLLCGVRKDGGVVGVDVSDEAIQQLANRLRSTKILPNPSANVFAHEIGGKRILVVRVEPAVVPPLIRADGVAWVRTGTSTRRAVEADLVRLGERRPETHLPFDLQRLDSATLEDLNLPALRERYVAERESNDNSETFPSFERWLGQRDIGRERQGVWAPTVAGLLVFGHEPQRYFPGAIVEFVRYAGNEVDAPVARRKTLSGALPAQLEGLWAQLAYQQTDVPRPSQGIRTPYGPDYPLEALRELARNLIQHRLYAGTHSPGRVSWFDNRVELSNPGARYGYASEGEFGEHSDYRNPTITRFLVETGYVERLGRGINLVRAALRKNGNPDLQHETNGFVTVTVHRISSDDPPETIRTSN